ncbi:unnamed protein product [Linum trigynum]|uniref:Zinc knuckle CX2CX4HX4C domain-containing protein n=1 Tax=Linum trigynum TaxID=586398 RepID=A0AAV2GNF2_9ROSI
MVPDEERVNNRFSLVVKVFSERTVSLRAMRGMIRSAWVDNFKPKLQEMPIIQPVVENIFTLDFEKREEMEAIWKERPSPISGTLMQLKRLSGLENAQNISFKMVEFWVQIHNLPEAYRTENNIAMVSRMFHKVIEIDQAAFQAQIYRKFVRVFVEIDTSKTIPDGFYIRHQQKRIWIKYKYEKLFSLCYFCGGIEHTRSECGLRRKNEEEGLPLPSIQRWRPWTRASSPLFSPRTSQQQVGEAYLNRAATSTSNSPGGFQIQSPPTTGMGTTRSLNQMAPLSSMISPAPNQSPRSSFAQNFSFPPTTDLFPTPNSFLPSPQSYSQFGQSLGVISSPSQGTNMSRNLFGFPSGAPFPNSIPQIPSYQDPLPGFITSNQSPLPYQAHANYIFNQNYFHSSPSGA